jgi:hypothetical protein
MAELAGATRSAREVYREFVGQLLTLQGVILGLLVGLGNSNGSGSSLAGRVTLVALLVGMIFGLLTNWGYQQEEAPRSASDNSDAERAGRLARFCGPIALLASLFGLVSLLVYGWGRVSS